MRRTLAAGALALSTSLAAVQAPPSADELARRLQASYDDVRAFTADFTQTYAGGLLGLTTTERGELKIKKPGRFRMEYLAPEKKTFVGDGVMIYSYYPADKVATRDPMPEEDEASTALLFLAGQGNLVRDFTPRLADAQPDGEWHLALTPKARQAEFETLTLMVDRRTLSLRGFAWTDDQGGTTTTRFTELRENVTLADREFEFTIPPGVIIR